MPRRMSRRRISYSRRRSLSRRFLRWLLIPMLAAMVAALVTEALDFVMLKLMSRDVSQDCAITRVIDGDTVALSCRTNPATRGRIRGIDAPELFSASCLSEAIAAQRARFALQRMLWSAKVTRITTHGTDIYDRELVTILADGADVAQSMVAAGHARRYDGGQRQGWC